MVFVDGFLILIGVVLGDGGCYVVNSIEFFYFVDMDGDGKVDWICCVLIGFGIEDIYYLLYMLCWGYDGMLYMN